MKVIYLYCFLIGWIALGFVVKIEIWYQKKAYSVVRLTTDIAKFNVAACDFMCVF